MFRTHLTTSAYLILLLLLASIFIVGVSGCAPQKPEMVVANFSVAIYEKNTDKAKRYCTQNFADTQLGDMEALSSIMPSNMGGTATSVPKASEIAEGLESTVSGATASVWATGADFMVYMLVKEGGTWKISSIDFNMPAGMPEGMPEGMPGM
ncbi:MAG: hypothetical protein NTY09_04640 [bacterium]|nr:hypothetical protein [bacterium]